MNCEDCNYSFLKDTKERPVCCCKCEINYHWKQLIPDLPLYHLLIKTLDKLTELITWIEKKIRR